MGDNGKLYVNDGLIPVYKECIIPLADILTPNLFEAEILTDMKITNENVWRAIDVLHKKGCKTVVITSAELTDNDCLRLFASSTLGIYLNMSLLKSK